MARKRFPRRVVGFELDDLAVHAAVIKPGAPATLIRYLRTPLPAGAVVAGTPVRRGPIAEAVAALAEELTDLRPFRTAVAIGGQTTPTGPDVLMRWTTRGRPGPVIATLASVMLGTVRAFEDGGLKVTATHLTPPLLTGNPFAGLRAPEEVMNGVPRRALVVAAAVALTTARRQNLEDPRQPWQPLPPVPLGHRPVDRVSWCVERVA